MQINRESILSILAPSLILLSRFLTYILYHDYGILNREVILSLSVICLVGMLVGVPLAITGSSRFRAFGFVILLFIFFDLQFDLINSINQYLADEDVALHRYVTLTAALFIVCIIIMMMHEHIATIIATMFAITILTTIVLPNQKVNLGPQPVSVYTKPESDKTPIIHLVLDEHIGIEGLPRDIEGGDELREFLIDFYERWGFRLYGRAYSKYFTTHNSLSNLLNGETSPINAMLANTVYQHGIASWVPVQNDYFTRVTESDYRIRVYQSDYFDFCQNPLHRIEYCFQYLSSSPQLLKRTNLSVTEKAELLLGGYYFSADSSILRVIQGIYNRVSSISYGLLPAWEYKNYEFTSLSGPAVITRLKNDIASNSRGRLFFAHLLLPHYPYVWDADCQLRMNSDTWLTRRLHLKTQTSDTKYRRAAYRYFLNKLFARFHCWMIC